VLIFAIAFIILMAAGVLALRHGVRRSVEGYEDETGFHFGHEGNNPARPVQIADPDGSCASDLHKQMALLTNTPEQEDLTPAAH